MNGERITAGDYLCMQKLAVVFKSLNYRETINSPHLFVSLSLPSEFSGESSTSKSKPFVEDMSWITLNVL